MKLTVDGVLGLFFLTVLANVCYCAAYLVVGTAFAATIAHFFAQSIFGG